MIKCLDCVHLIICGWHMGGANLSMASQSCKNYESKAEHDGCEGCKWQPAVDDDMPCKKCKSFYMDLWERGGND